MRYEARVESIRLENDSGAIATNVEMGENTILKIAYVIDSEIPDMDMAVLISKDSIPLLYSYDVDTQDEMRYRRQPGHYACRVKLPTELFKEGSYLIQVLIGTTKNISDSNACIKFEIINTKLDLKNKSYRADRPGFIYRDLDWTITKKD